MTFLKMKRNKNLQVTKSFKDKCKTQEENEQMLDAGL